MSGFCQNGQIKGSNTLPLSKKLGQMFILGFASETSSGFEQEGMTELMENQNIGGVILFDQSSTDKTPRNIRNAKQLKALTNYIKELKTTHPPLISIDQEGGAVERLKIKLGFVEVRAPQELAALGGKAVSCGARIIGTQLDNYGINLNFAPVADATTSTSLAFKRTFSEAPEQLELFSKLVIRELHKVNVGATLKHFPGMSLSKTFGDTHLETVALSENWKSEGPKTAFAPFNKLKYDADLIMISHLMNPVDGAPSSISQDVVGFLRKEIGYQGLIVTDDVDMKGIPETLSLTETVKAAIKAGVDLVLIGNNLKYRPEDIRIMLAEIQDAVLSGEIKPSRIEESYQRVRQFKAKLRLARNTISEKSLCSDKDLKTLWPNIVRSPDLQDEELLRQQNLNPEDWMNPTALGFIK
ncbi:MAG: hypothetical protein RJB66_1786 [Pseudomonadota bacterium]